MSLITFIDVVALLPYTGAASTSRAAVRLTAHQFQLRQQLQQLQKTATSASSSATTTTSSEATTRC
jgi:hypothetical protein